MKNENDVSNMVTCLQVVRGYSFMKELTTDIWNSIPVKIRGSVKRASKPGFRRGLKDLLMGLLASEDQYLNVANIIKTLNKVT